MTVVTSQSPSGVAQPVTFTATVGAAAPGSGTPTGSVTFTFGDGSPTSRAPLFRSGQATATHTYATDGGFVYGDRGL